jgi:hypothetical protein
MRALGIAAIIAVIAPGCGLTFGVDAIERVTEVDADATGVTAFVLPAVSVEDRVTVCGDDATDRVTARVRTVEWADGPSSANGVDADLALVAGDLELHLDGGDETVTLQAIEVDVPDTLPTSLAVSDGGLTVCDLAAPVTAAANRVELRDVAAPALVTAPSVSVDNLVPLELDASGAVTGTLGADGSIVSGGSVTLSVTSVDIDELSIHTDASDAFVSLFLPPGGSWTISIQSDSNNGLVEVGDVSYSSQDPEAPLLSDGLVFEVNGGGAVIDVTTTSGGIFIRESTE